MVGNPPSQRVAAVPRKKIDNMQHPNGKTLVNIGHQIVDLRSHGRNSAADVRASNNGLVGTGNYCDDMSSAIAASLASLKPVDCSNDDGLTEAEQDWFARDNIKPPVSLKMSAANGNDHGGGKMPARQRANDDGGGKCLLTVEKCLLARGPMAVVGCRCRRYRQAGHWYRIHPGVECGDVRREEMLYQSTWIRTRVS